MNTGLASECAGGCGEFRAGMTHGDLGLLGLRSILLPVESVTIVQERQVLFLNGTSVAQAYLR